MENQKLKLQILSPMHQIQEKRMFCMDIESRLESRMEAALTRQKHRMALYTEKLKGLSPLDKLNQGFSYVEDDAGHVFNDIRNAKIGSLVNIYVKNGRATARIEQAERIKK